MNILTRKDKLKLHHDGHLFVFHKYNVDFDVKFWRCEEFNKANVKCNARLHTSLVNEVLKELNTHVCDTDEASIQVQRIVNGIKRRAADTLEAPSQIRAHALQNVATPVLAQVPTRNATNVLIKRVRKEANAPPAAPESVTQLQIPEQYRFYQRNDEQRDQFLLADSGVYTENGNAGQQRLLIFGRMSNGRWAAEMEHCYVDGTFAAAPTIFYQIFVLLAKRRNWVFPVAYGLLTTKTTATYVRFFQMLKQCWSDFNPRQMSMDYEMAVILSVQEVFPACQINGCLFHLVQNMKKQIAEAGLTRRYRDMEFALNARMITSISFLPLSDITNAIRALENYLPPELQPVLDWFVTNYTGRVRFDGTRNQPRFDLATWSVHRRVLEGDDRTNNYAEAAHRKLQRAFGCAHPSVWRFIDTLRREQKSVDADYAQCQRGVEPPKKAKKYVKADRCILNLVRNYQPQPVNQPNHDHQYVNPRPQNYHVIIDFLRGISHNYKMDP